MKEEIEELFAKPNETIRQHTDALLEQVKLLAKYGYITSNNLLSDLNAACEYHDSGKPLVPVVHKPEQQFHVPDNRHRALTD